MTYFIAIWIAICPICTTLITVEVEGYSNVSEPYENCRYLVECPNDHIAIYARLKSYIEVSQEYDEEKYKEWEQQHPQEECPFYYTKEVRKVLYEQKAGENKMTNKDELQEIILKDLNEYNEFDNLPYPEKGKDIIADNLATAILNAGWVKIEEKVKINAKDLILFIRTHCFVPENANLERFERMLYLAGYINKDEIEVDEEKLTKIINEELGAGLAHAISTKIKELIK